MSNFQKTKVLQKMSFSFVLSPRIQAITESTVRHVKREKCLTQNNERERKHEFI